MEDKMEHYSSRSELPPFKEMLSIATNTVDMPGLDFRTVVPQFMPFITDLIFKEIRITFLLLDPQSKRVDTEDLKESIIKSMKLLFDAKEQLSLDIKGNLIIRTYDYSLGHDMIFIDIDNYNAWIKVEERPAGIDANSRTSDAWYKRDDESRYNSCLEEYNKLFTCKNCREWGSRPYFLK
jgi:hypothetical protein